MGTVVHPTGFPKFSPPKRKEWERMQSMDLRTLYASYYIRGSSQKQDDTVADLCDCGLHIADGSQPAAQTQDG